MHQRQRLGRWGEEYVQHWLSHHGYIVLEKNVRTAFGELDVVARLDDLLVIIEVKLRRTERFGSPEQAITPKKMRHLTQATEDYVHAIGWKDGYRIDLISLSLINGRWSLKHLHSLGPHDLA